ncbi:hypothetical protein B0H14DRAFT_2755058, partial [Mycena olivaceomarginata]
LHPPHFPPVHGWIPHYWCTMLTFTHPLLMLIVPCTLALRDAPESRKHSSIPRNNFFFRVVHCALSHCVAGLGTQAPRRCQTKIVAGYMGDRQDERRLLASGTPSTRFSSSLGGKDVHTTKAVYVT